MWCFKSYYYFGILTEILWHIVTFRGFLVRIYTRSYFCGPLVKEVIIKIIMEVNKLYYFYLNNTSNTVVHETKYVNNIISNTARCITCTKFNKTILEEDLLGALYLNTQHTWCIKYHHQVLLLGALHSYTQHTRCIKYYHQVLLLGALHYLVQENLLGALHSNTFTKQLNLVQQIYLVYCIITKCSNLVQQILV